jgi:hypothetical protein
MVVAGFLSGGIGSGSLQGAMAGAFSAGAFHGIGVSMGDKVTPGKVLAHGMAGGVMSELQGGKFGHGFASAAVTQLMSPVISQVNANDTDFNAGRVAVAALVGGTTSALTGGKFANGALTAAFSRAYNDESTARKMEERMKDRFKIDGSRAKGVRLFALNDGLNFELAGQFPDIGENVWVIIGHGNPEDGFETLTDKRRAPVFGRPYSTKNAADELVGLGLKQGDVVVVIACNGGVKFAPALRQTFKDIYDLDIPVTGPQGTTAFISFHMPSKKEERFIVFPSFSPKYGGGFSRVDWKTYDD